MPVPIQLKSGERYLFDIEEANPFLIFPWLQKIAFEVQEPSCVIDLSRGDPGYGFSPSERSRRFVSYLLFLDSALNTAEKRFFDFRDGDELLSSIRACTSKSYREELANMLLQDFDEYLERLGQIAGEQGLPNDEWALLVHLFAYSNVSGGNYHQPWGEPHTRAVLAHWHSKEMGMPVRYQDLLPVSGSSHAIGALYEALGEEGIGYLREGDPVVLFSPSYYPYVNLHLSRKLNTVMIRMDPLTGKIDKDDLEKVSKLPIKMIVVIDPNNPTGFPLSEQDQDIIAEFAEKTNALLVTDEVYHSFLPGKKSLIQHPLAEKRTIRIDSLSKIERSTGIRFGDIMITEEGERYITKLFSPLLRKGDTIRTLLYRAKSPGGGQIGPFHHTTVIPGPCQFLGISHILFGSHDREQFVRQLRENMKIFHEVLGIPYHGSLYYSLFDLKHIPGWSRKEKSPEEIFIDLAKRGLALLPANGFFLPEDRKTVDRSTMVRVSLGNATTEKCKKAAEIILNYKGK